MRLQKPAHRALTMIEVLVAISVVGMFTGFLLVGVQSVRNSAARVHCANNLKQIGLAAQGYDPRGERLPPHTSLVPGPQGRKVFVPWTFVLLPLIEHEALYRQGLDAYRTAYGCENPPHVGLATVIKTYSCYSDHRLVEPITDDLGYTAAYSSYAGVLGSDRGNGVMGLASRFYKGTKYSDIRDGLSQTLLIGERPPRGEYLYMNWYTLIYPNDPRFGPPEFYRQLVAFMTQDYATSACPGPYRYGPGRLDNHCDGYHFWSLHPGGANFVFCDGSVRFMPYSAQPIMNALATIAGGEVVVVPD